MASPHSDESQLLIRCPSCGQRFKVGEELKERTVECGGCEHRFRIDDEVIVRNRKVYPGERVAADLNRFHRVPMTGSASQPSIESTRYGKLPDPSVLEPMSPQRILAGIVGASGIVAVSLLLLFGTTRGGMLDGMDLTGRLLMGGFTALLGVGLLVYANPKARAKAFLVGALMSAGMLTIPFFFRTGTGDGKAGGTIAELTAVPALPSEPVKTASELALEELRNQIGTGPLDDEIARLQREGSKLRAVGVWLRGMQESHRYLVKDYILRVTRADEASHFYPRDGGNFLMVVTGIDSTLEEVAEMAKALGNVEKIYPELALVEVAVRNENFVEGSQSKLTNKEDAAFYELNKRELESIDLKRVEKSVDRLAEAEPKIYRADVTRRLIELLAEPEVEFKGRICSALMVWSAEPGPAGEAALAEVRRLTEQKKDVSKEMIELLVKERNAAVIPVLDELWFKNPLEWEDLYGSLGPAAETELLDRFPETEGTIRYSAVRILGRVGGPDSLGVLKAAESGADSELKVLLDQAGDSIRTRSSRPSTGE
ncbi:MAG: hypothetical protein V4640_12725 [Verrucomicrobiota bacterium]